MKSRHSPLWLLSAGCIFGLAMSVGSIELAVCLNKVAFGREPQPQTKLMLIRSY